MNHIPTPQELIDLIASVTPLTPEQYPALGQLTGEPRENFIIGHSVRHLSAFTGAMQKAIENAEHGEPLDKKTIARKITACSFAIYKLCEVMKISGDEWAREIESMANELK